MPTYETGFKSSFNFQNEQEKVEHFNKCFQPDSAVMLRPYGNADPLSYVGFVKSKAFLADFIGEHQESEDQTDYFSGSIAMVKISYQGKTKFVSLDQVCNWYGKLEEEKETEISTEEMMTRR